MITLQQLKTEIIFKIPSHLVLVEKVEYDQLKYEQLSGKWWTLTDLENATKRKRLWLQDNILYVPKFKKELEQFVHYPQYRGDNWLFQATKMAKFLEDNFYKIFNP